MPASLGRLLRSAARVTLLFSLLALLAGLSVSRPVWVSEAPAADSPAVDPDALRAHVDFLSHLPDRSSASPSGMAAAALYIEQQLRQRGGRIQRQQIRVDGQVYDNVIAHHGPKDGATTIVGAHYDAYGGFPGADDNASGVAGLIELAGLLAVANPDQPITLVAYALEEPPHYAGRTMGSHVHAQSLDGQPVKLMISIEMIGYYSDAPGSQRYPLPGLGLLYPDRGNFIAVVDRYFANDAVALKSAINRYTNLPAYSVNAPEALPGVDFSDHRSYWSLGIPAVMVTDTAFYRNPHYHTAADTAERLDYVKMAEVVRGIYHFLQDSH